MMPESMKHPAKKPAAGAKELQNTGMRRKGTPSGTGYAGYRKKKSAPEGEQEARKVMGEQGYRTDAGTTDGDDEAVWIIEGYDPENLAPCKAGDVSFEPGSEVTFPEEHEVYPGETGVVLAVGTGTGAYDGTIVYDVLIEGTKVPERVAEYDLEA